MKSANSSVLGASPLLRHRMNPLRNTASVLRPSTRKFHPKKKKNITVAAAAATSPPQRTIMDCISGVSGRGKGGMAPEQQALFDTAVAQLENSSSGASSPAASPSIEGRWRLVYTSRPGTASPIQRTFTGVDSFTVYQEIIIPSSSSSSLSSSSSSPPPRVNNIVDFGPSVGLLKVEAQASTDARPLPGFTPRKGKGLPFGLLGVSITTPPASPNTRIDFQFDRAAFYFKSLPFTIPYPVPFQLLGDERKGWIDVSYLSKDGKFRLSRGNKGTLFVLVKDDTPKEQLLDRIASKASDSEVSALIEAVEKEGGGVRQPARSTAATGEWRLIWSQQQGASNPLQRQLSGSFRTYQIISSDGKTLENRVDVVPGVVRVRALADAAPQSASRTGVVINEVVVEVGPWKIPLTGDNKGAEGFVDWLYLDDDVRITRGNKGSVFVHVRDG